MKIFLFHTSWLAVLAALVHTACNSDHRPACAASDGGDCDVVMCRAQNSTFPTFDKTCHTVDDCAFAVHQTNCCGSTLAIGFSKAEQSRFAADEKTCLDQYPLCACPQTPTMTEDGQFATSGKTIVVQCQSGMCMTTLN